MAEAGLWEQLAGSPWVKPFVWLVVAAGLAFAVGMFVKYRRAAIQREYQRRIEEAKKPPRP